MFSDGEDNSSSHDMMTAIETAQANNVLVYTIRYTETKKNGDLTARNHYGIRVMDRIAKETGGAHIDADFAPTLGLLARLRDGEAAELEIGE